mmetsp:Transcript_240/g.812  ORF Transcript_240/g.812 Transcript_240/m.812 type:complete len:213 (+) Transcript_240:140-778(+)
MPAIEVASSRRREEARLPFRQLQAKAARLQFRRRQARAARLACRQVLFLLRWSHAHRLWRRPECQAGRRPKQEPLKTHERPMGRRITPCKRLVPIRPHRRPEGHPRTRLHSPKGPCPTRTIRPHSREERLRLCPRKLRWQRTNLQHLLVVDTLPVVLTCQQSSRSSCARWPMRTTRCATALEEYLAQPMCSTRNAGPMQGRVAPLAQSARSR